VIAIEQGSRCPGCHVVCETLDAEHLDGCPHQGRNAMLLIPRPTTTCPQCGRKTVTKRDGIFQWRACPATKTCGWTVFS